MSDYKIERDDFDEYRNGICFLKQNACPNRLIISAHIHNSIEIIYIKKGEFTIHSNDSKYQLFAGDCILFRSNVNHYIIAGSEPDASYYFLKIKPSELKNFTTLDYQNEYTMCFTVDSLSSKQVWKASEIDSSLHRIKEGFNTLISEFHQKTEHSEILQKIAVEGILFDMFSSVRSADSMNYTNIIPRDTVNAICKAMLFINKNYTEDITCEQLCRMVNLSYSYFSRTFKEITGNTFKEYLNICRINFAESLLINTNKTAVEICMESGFNNPAYFSKVYKDIKGISPITARKKKTMI